jgi:hypothetical protein
MTYQPTNLLANLATRKFLEESGNGFDGVTQRFFVRSYNLERRYEGFDLKMICMILAVLMFLPVYASAVSDSVITGPYNVSFDLGLPKNIYNIDVKNPKSSETLGGAASKTYPFLVQIKNTTTQNSAIASIYVVISVEKQAVVPSAQRVSLNRKEIEALGYFGVQGAARQIDGKDGVVCSGLELVNGRTPLTYFADYYLSNSEKVFIYSGIPWDEGTLQLLKTIHVEKVNSNS